MLKNEIVTSAPKSGTQHDFFLRRRWRTVVRRPFAMHDGGLEFVRECPFLNKAQLFFAFSSFLPFPLAGFLAIGQELDAYCWGAFSASRPFPFLIPTTTFTSQQANI
jgi:hypothetical protein